MLTRIPRRRDIAHTSVSYGYTACKWRGASNSSDLPTILSIMLIAVDSTGEGEVYPAAPTWRFVVYPRWGFGSVVKCKVGWISRNSPGTIHMKGW